MRRVESVKRLIILMLSFVELLCLTALYAYAWYNVYFERVSYRLNFYSKGHWGMIGIYFIMLFFFMSTYGATKIGYLKFSDILFSQIFAILCTNFITYMQLCLMSMWMVRIPPMLYLTGLEILIAAAWAFLCQIVYSNIFPPREMLLVYGERSIEDILAKFATRKDKYHIVKCMNISEGVDAIEKEATQRYGAVVLWDIPVQERNDLMKFCYARSLRFYMMPKITDVIIKGATPLHLFDTPVFLTREYELTIEERFAKRLVDIICSLILLVIASPFMLVTAIAVKCYDGGPILYKQTRCTIGGKEFGILKFRSMGVDAEKDGVARLASKHDSRITPVGKFIRMVRLDELPQLWNILKGDMSFIGPRPERPEIIDQYMEDMPEFAFRMKVKAGLAGYAQVYGKYNTTPYDKLKLDLFYIENYSLWLDLKLMLLTLKILFKPESTEGIETSQTTAKKEN
ncbi:MAG: exopolysaccharide biosynthesis polyprenyl glycosylphosphotransferase [Lachnospiraceae bacterium]|nr:exopolysaccharide biosynthesis polyprenyl glycosylphosphotransferase [Lachnospiraceae bacterium]